MFIFKEIAGQPDDETIKKLAEFYASIFERVEPGKLEKRIAGAVDLLTILALHEDKIVGFKLGHRSEPKIFYSWVGGVDENFRQNGIAGELMRRQHEWCRRKGFETIQTKTMNRFKPMLILNLKHGFDIIEVYRDANDEIKIILEKKLAQ